MNIFLQVDNSRLSSNIPISSIDQTEYLTNAAFPQAFLNLGGDVDECTARGGVEPKFIAVGFHRHLELYSLGPS